MIYLLLGDDTKAKDQKIEELKKKYLSSPDALLFDYDSLHAPKLSAEILKKSLLNLPTFSSKRLIVIRSIQKLDNQNKNLLLEFIQSSPKHLVLILDAEAADQSSAFIKRIESSAQVFRFGQKQTTNVFDMTKAIERKDLTSALKVLYELFQEGQHPLQVMGAVVWFWGKQKSRLSAKKFSDGLLALQEADLNIKRSRQVPEYAMEVLMTKLYLLQI